MSSGPSGAAATSPPITLPTAVSVPCIASTRPVRKYDGHTHEQRTPYSASSWPVVSLSATTPALTAL